MYIIIFLSFSKTRKIHNKNRSKHRLSAAGLWFSSDADPRDDRGLGQRLPPGLAVYQEGLHRSVCLGDALEKVTFGRFGIALDCLQEAVLF